MKGECRVECKKWSAKGKCRKASAGKCRKASADKEHTQDANTLGGSDHVRIYGLPPLPPTSDFVFMCYCVCVFGVIGLWDCGIVSLWVCGLVLGGVVCRCLCVCDYMRAVCFLRVCV